ncbi:hypothetical protein BDY24DRAFT_382788 [Mrakia frigida]|uniref:uncharacterized protein n=1 Tax=Mrakia frigida TaxID=29902 RepID=UPI003FCC1A47
MFEEPTSLKELLFACSHLDDSGEDEEESGDTLYKLRTAGILETSESRARFSSFSLALSLLSEEDVLLNFGFTTPHIHRLVQTLQIPSPFSHRNSIPVLSSLEALCIGLYFLKNPSGSSNIDSSDQDLNPIFNRSEKEVSLTARLVLSRILVSWAGLLQWDLKLLGGNELEAHAVVVRKKMKKSWVGKGTIWGFLGTSSWELEEFQGKRKMRKKSDEVQPTRKSLQFQAVLLPNGLFAYVSGGWRPSVSPTSIFNFSGLPDRLLRYSHRAGTIPAESLCIYSDTDASPTPTHLGRFKVGIHEVGRKEELANNEMENLRGYVNVEMEEMGRNWGLLKDKKASKIDGTPISVFFAAAFLLQNAKCCLSNGNEASSFFKHQPPSLEEYFHDKVKTPKIHLDTRKESPERYF